MSCNCPSRGADAGAIRPARGTRDDCEHLGATLKTGGESSTMNPASAIARARARHVVLCDISRFDGALLRRRLHATSARADQRPKPRATRSCRHALAQRHALPALWDVDQSLAKVPCAVEDWSGGKPLIGLDLASSICAGRAACWDRPPFGPVHQRRPGPRRRHRLARALMESGMHKSANIGWINPLLRTMGFEPNP